MVHGLDAGQDEIDAGQELLAVVVLAQVRSGLAHGRVANGVELGPLRGDGGEEGRSVGLAAGERAGVGGVLAGDAEDVVDEHAGGVGQRPVGHAEGLQMLADALVDVQQGRPPGISVELGADPGVGGDRVEQADRDGPQRLPGLGAGARDAGDDVVSGRREQVVPVGDVVIDRPVAGGQAHGERPQGQGVLALGEGSAAARTQGGLLDIHPWNGQQALAAAGLTEKFSGLVLPGRESYRVLDRVGRVLLDRPDDGAGQRPEVARGELRQLLLDSLPDGAVQWGRKVSGVQALGGGRHQLRFADGATVNASALIGADGAWSRVRPLLSDATPQYLGVTSVEYFLLDSGTRHRAAAEAVGAGSLFALAPGRGFLAYRETEGTVHVYVQLTVAQDWLADVNAADPASVSTRVAAEFDGWAPELTALITDSDTAPVVRPLYTLPAGHRWARVPGVTVIGDAAHLAPPNGEGANLAMLDGAELGQAVAAHPGNVEVALAEYEQAMFPRAAAEAGGEDIYDIMLGDDAPHSWIAMMNDAEQAS
jgi:2-polyprenyl-6-methoxyphenol hydroxylase-like FAD-dependent oxidoreductase